MASTLGVDTITNAAGTGAPNFSQGLTSAKALRVSGRVNTVSSANYTITDTDGYDVIAVTTGASDRTITLPSVSANTGRVIMFKKVDSGAGALVVDTPSTETIDGSAQNRLRSQYSFLTIVSDGSNWHILDVVDTLGSSATDVTVNANVGTTGQYFDTISFVLPEGTWLATGMILYTRNAATISAVNLDIGFTTVAGNSSPALESRNNSDTALSTTFVMHTLTSSNYVISVTNNTTTLYMKGYVANYSAATPQYRAAMRLQRIR